MKLSGWTRLWIVASVIWWLGVGAWLWLVERPTMFPPPLDPRVCVDAEACFTAPGFPHFQFRSRFDFRPPAEGTPEWEAAVIDFYSDARIWEHEDATAAWGHSWAWWWAKVAVLAGLPLLLVWPVWPLAKWVRRGF